VERDWLTNENCSVARTLEVIGERWTMLVLREAFFRVRRFEEFQRNTGAARNILSDRLRTLVEHGILERRKYQDHPPRFEYRLTEKGVDLYPVLISLMEWGDRHAPGGQGPAVVLEHRTCGQPTRPTLVCSACGERVTAREMRALPGPGAMARGA
jgi:DNA-binding HxlR family transcriptional regulator